MAESPRSHGAEPVRRTALRRTGDKPKETQVSEPWLIDSDIPKRYYGKEYERDLIGPAKLAPDTMQRMQEFMSRYTRPDGSRKFVQPEAVIPEVIKGYAGDPLMPEREFTKALRDSICAQAGLSGKDCNLVKFYSTVDHPVADPTGVDAFVAVTDRLGQIAAVTLDATINPQKEEHKADVIIQTVPVHAGEKWFKEASEFYAKLVLRSLENKMSGKNMSFERLKRSQ